MEKPKYFRANDEGLSYVVLHNFQQYFSHIVAISFIGGGNREYLLKITDLLQVTEKRVLHRVHLPMSGIQLTT
jgi:hypothetical protein